MKNILWSNRIPNEEVTRRVGEVRKLVNLIRCRKRNWIGHIVREEGILKQVSEDRMEEKRKRGRQRKRMLDELIVSTYGNMKRRAEKRRKWRRWLLWDRLKPNN
jgi:hypothetical protein